MNNKPNTDQPTEADILLWVETMQEQSRAVFQMGEHIKSALKNRVKTEKIKELQVKTVLRRNARIKSSSAACR